MTDSEISLLAKTGTYRRKKLNGKVRETHISWVILNGRYAFKFKKPVKLPFLNSSTLALRRKLCRQEVSLNRRLTDIYLDVLPVRRYGDRYEIGGSSGRTIDYTVRMRRLDEKDRLDNRLRTDSVPHSQIRKLADVIANFHNSAMRIEQSAPALPWRELFNEISDYRKFVEGKSGSRYVKIINDTIRASDLFLRCHENRLEERARAGFIRDVHGDLHCGNVFLGKDPIIFDCIEFDKRYRQIDILYEIAFLIMDMEALGRKKCADELLKQYLKTCACVQTQEDFKILDYFKCLRANVRAKVHLISAREKRNVREVRSHLTQANRYLRLMSKYSLMDNE